MSEAADGYNPEYDPTGIEGGLDTNLLPWIDVPNTDGISMKTVRASMESGMFSLILKIEEGKAFPPSVFLGGMDLLLLSGELDFSQGGQTSLLKPGTWGFVPANIKVDSIKAKIESGHATSLATPSGFGAGTIDIESSSVSRVAS